MKKADVKNLIKSLEADMEHAEEQMGNAPNEPERQYWVGRWTALDQTAKELKKLVETKKKAM